MADTTTTTTDDNTAAASAQGGLGDDNKDDVNVNTDNNDNNNNNNNEDNKDNKDNNDDDDAGGLDDDDDVELSLESKDKEVHKIMKNVAMQSALIKTMWMGDQSQLKIALPNVEGSILKKVIEYLNKHHKNPAKEIEKPLKSANMKEIVDEWDANFVEVDQENLFQMILAANYMDIKPLLDLTCAKVASMIKGKTPEEIRKTFNIQGDFTPEEEEAVRAENKWASDN